MLLWIVNHWSVILGDIGIIAGLFFSGLGFWMDVRIRRAQTVLELTKSHRDLWSLVRSTPVGRALHDRERDLGISPRTDAETDLVNLLLLHLRSAFRASKAGIYVLPERLHDDISDLFAVPVVRDAWEELKTYHDADFVVFVERAAPKKR